MSQAQPQLGGAAAGAKALSKTSSSGQAKGDMFNKSEKQKDIRSTNITAAKGLR